MLKKYGFFGFLSLVKSFIYTKVFFNQARLIRLPFDVRGKQYMIFGKGFTTGFGNRLQVDLIENNQPLLSFGRNVQINDYCHIACVNRVAIGNDVLIASKVFITDHDHGKYVGDNQDSPQSVPKNRKLFFSSVTIEDRVWIGENVVILPGVTVGEGSIIGASSVVTRSVPANSIAVGNPARVLKTFNFSTNKWDLVK